MACPDMVCYYLYFIDYSRTGFSGRPQGSFTRQDHSCIFIWRTGILMVQVYKPHLSGTRVDIFTRFFDFVYLWYRHGICAALLGIEQEL